MSKFMSELDHHSAKLSRVCLKKGGVAGRKIAEIMASINEVCDSFLWSVSDLLILHSRQHLK